MKRTILLTGASGFVGQHMARLLLRRGFDVTALQRGSLGITLPRGVKSVYADLTDPASLAGLPKRWHGVIHLAGASIPASFRTMAPVVQNVAMSLNLLEHLEEARVLLTSSCHVYAPSDRLRLEGDALLPQGRYGLSKHLVEQMVPHFAHRLDIRIARPFNHLGPRQRPELVIPSLLRRLSASREDGSPVLMRGWNSVRDFIDVRDVAEAYLAILELGPLEQATFNVCTGQARSIGDLVATVLGILDSRREVVFEGKPNSSDDIPYLVGSPERLKAVSGWDMGWSLEQSLRAMLESLPEEV